MIEINRHYLIGWLILSFIASIALVNAQTVIDYNTVYIPDAQQRLQCNVEYVDYDWGFVMAPKLIDIDTAWRSE